MITIGKITLEKRWPWWPVLPESSQNDQTITIRVIKTCVSESAQNFTIDIKAIQTFPTNFFHSFPLSPEASTKPQLKRCWLCLVSVGLPSVLCTCPQPGWMDKNPYYIARDAKLLTQTNRLSILKYQIFTKTRHYHWPVGPGPVKFQKNVCSFLKI